MKFYVVAAVTIKYTVRGQLCIRAGETFINCVRKTTLRLATHGMIAS